MSSLSKGDRVVYTGKGVFTQSRSAIGQVGTVRKVGINTAEIAWDNADKATAPPMGCFTDNLALAKADNVGHPKHYTSHPSGIECIEVVKHMGFTLGNVIKYVWRADLKGNALEDLRKARAYIDIEIATREAAS